MKYRVLGRTGIRVSEVGFGAWGIGGRTAGETSYGETDDRVSLDALARAFDVGINFFDTSSVYGRSEHLIGQTFCNRRDRVVIATKVGFIAYDQPPDYSPAFIRRSLEESLRRLRSDYVDLLQLHNPALDVLERDGSVLQTLEALQREGKIRAYGMSFKSPGECVTGIQQYAVPVVQANLNMMDLRALDSGLLDVAARHQVAVIARTPLCFGYLSGTIGQNTSFNKGDHRRRWPQEQHNRWVQGARSLFGAVPVPAGQTHTQVALRFCLSFPVVATVIPGILTPAQADENAAASDHGSLSTDQVGRVREINSEMDFVVRRPSPPGQSDSHKQDAGGPSH